MQTKTTPSPITIAESKRRIELEQAVTNGEREFVRVGLALVELRDRKLYRNDFDTFEEYCHAQWGWGEKRASQIIIAASVAKSLPDSTICRNESTARELAKVEPDRRAEIAAKAAETGKVTAKSIREASEKSVPRAEEPVPQPPAPLSDEAKQYRLSLRIQETKDFVSEKLTGLTNLEMMKYADSLKQLARRIEETVAKNEQDLAA